MVPLARGATDNKGEFLSRIWGIEAYLATMGRCRAGSGSWSRARRSPAASTSTPCSTCGPELRQADGALIEGGDDRRRRPSPSSSAGSGGSSSSSSSADDRLRRPLEPRRRSSRTRRSGWRRPSPRCIDRTARPTFAGSNDGVLAADAGAARDRRCPAGRGVADMRTRLRGRAAHRRVDGHAAWRAMTFDPTLQHPGTVVRATSAPATRRSPPAEAHARLDMRLVPDQHPAGDPRRRSRPSRRGGFADIEIG